MIAAYADGELEGEVLREVEAAIAADPKLQAEVDAHLALKVRLAKRFAPLLDRPIPTRFTALLAGGEAENKVVDYAEAVRKRAKPSVPGLHWRSFAGGALAASLVLALVAFGLSQQSSAGYAEGQLAAALDSQLVETQSPQASVRILLSFRDGGGRFCRGFSSAAQSGVACHDERGWKLRKVIGGQKAGEGEYRQAGSAEAEVLSAIQDTAQGTALDAEGERNAMLAGWRKN
ncbi:anti-sigma factor family protein [Novosphingobium sp. M1R2S20]|uniref:Anti-sigma factor n=1 Tax=Novosphingobium rhizovicinum TaxID=3228928 RepID=A0ABV3RD13_9SPHN